MNSSVGTIDGPNVIRTNVDDTTRASFDAEMRQNCLWLFVCR